MIMKAVKFEWDKIKIFYRESEMVIRKKKATITTKLGCNNGFNAIAKRNNHI